jgi:phosphopantothenoylcysteine decarboxylase / phosphopantothenate---cysteine ligase
MSFAGKQILLGVSGSIAAYKAADLCSQLSKLGADVHVVLTPHAAEFIGAATFRALTRNPVISGLFDEPQARRIAHIDLAQSADLVLVAPASANVIAKMAQGLADDMLTTCLLAVPPTTPLVVAPAMNTVMWEHPATVANVELLRRRGAAIVEPGYGLLACQDVGAGKLAEVADILRAAEDALADSAELAGVEFLITAGATRERLDPVRFLSNRSSGRMGFAIAEAAMRRGAAVTLVCGHVSVPPPHGATVLWVESAAEMLAACMANADRCGVFVGAAAVSDYTPETVAAQKIKKAVGGTETDRLLLRLRRTEDILAAAGARKRPDQLVVGFAAETEGLIDNARRKLKSKRADLIVANDVTQEGAGFDVDTNIVTLVTADAELPLPLLSKRDTAARILDEIVRMRARAGHQPAAGAQ